MAQAGSHTDSSAAPSARGPSHPQSHFDVSDDSCVKAGSLLTHKEA